MGGGGARYGSGIDGDQLFPPDPGQFGAYVTCDACGHRFPLYQFTLTASLGGIGVSVSAPVPERTEACPACGDPVDG